MNYASWSEKTRIDMADALIRLLTQKNYRKITVSDISKMCGVNRNTFYYHFCDMDALLELVGALEARRLGEACGAVNGAEQRLTKLMSEIFSRRDYYSEMLGQLGGDFILRVFSDAAGDVARLLAGTADRRRALAECVIGAAVGRGALEWLRGGMSETPEEISGEICDILTCRCGI